MRTLTSTETATQILDSVTPKVKITLSKSGESDVVIEEDRIISIPRQDESSNSQTAEVVCDNSDGFFTAKNLKGWTVVFDWGLVTSAGNEYSAVAPLVVLSQYESSAPGRLICRLTFIGIPDRLALDKASTDWLGHWSSTKTVKDLITEIADGTAVATELTEQQTTTDGWLAMNPQTFAGTVFTNIHGVGKRFGLTDTINKLSFKLKKNGSPSGTNVTFRVRDAESEAVLASVTYPISSITTGGGWCTATLATPLVVDLPLTFPGGVATGGLWIYCELVTGDATDYVSVAYNSVAVKGNEWLMVVGSVLGPVEFTDLDLGSKVYYADAGIGVFSHCQSYTATFDSEDAVIDTYCPADSFKIKEGTSRLDAINTLLAYTGCAKRVEDDGEIHIRVPVVTGATYDSEYALASGHKFFSKSVREALVLPNKVTVHSFLNDDNQYSGNATSAASYALLPVEDFIKARLASNAQGTSIAGARIKQLEINAQKGGFVAPINLGSEIIDYILVTDTRQNDTRTGNIGFIRRMYTPGKKFRMYVAFGDVALKGVKGTKPSELAVIRPELMLADEANLTLGDLRPILELISDNFVDIWDGGVSEDGAEYDGINDLAKNQALLFQSIATLFALLGYGENEDTTIQQILDNLLAYYNKEQANAVIDADVAIVNNKLDDTSVSDVQGSRAVDTNYQNSSTKLLLVSCGITWSTGGNRGSVQALIGNGSPPTTAVCRDSGETGASDHCSLTFLVPRGWYYKVAALGDTPDSIDSWVEIELF